MSETNSQKSFVIFLSSVRPVRMADRVLKLVKDEVEACGNVAITFDPRNMNFEIVKTPLHFMPSEDDAPAWMREANEQLKMADGFIMITAEYNSCIPPALTNMLDHFPPASYRHRPCTIVSYSMGGFGGIRSQTLLPILTIELGMLNLPRHVSIPHVKDVFNHKGECTNYKISAEIVRLVHEIGWFADAIRNKKKGSISPPS